MTHGVRSLQIWQAERLRLSELERSSHIPKEAALQTRVSELEALVSVLEASVREAQVTAEESAELNGHALHTQLTASKVGFVD